jgi:hypothetical protein
MKFGIGHLTSAGAGVRKFNKATSLESFARIFLRVKMKRDGYEYNQLGLAGYINSWHEWYMDTEDYNEDVDINYDSIIDIAADTLTYSNVHLLKLEAGSKTWMPLSSAEKSSFAEAIVARLNECKGLKVS